MVLLTQGQFVGWHSQSVFEVNAELPPKLQSTDPAKSGMGWHVVWMGVGRDESIVRALVPPETLVSAASPSAVEPQRYLNVGGTWSAFHSMG